jgi:serine/threonine protein kinase
MINSTQISFEPFQIGPYQILEEIGKGSLGRVYLGIDLKQHQKVAVKILRKRFHDDPKICKLFLMQAQRLSEFKHINLVPVYAYGTAKEGPYMVMPFIQGSSLSKHIQSHRLWSDVEILKITLQIAKALAHLHGQHFVHGDLKPENLLVIEKQGLLPEIQMIDPSLSDGKDGKIHGTPPYLSPEQLKNQVTLPVSDLYALGVILYEMTTGIKPFVGDLSSLVHQTLNQFPQKPSEQPNYQGNIAIEALIFNLMAKRQNERIQTAQELVEIIEKLIERTYHNTLTQSFIDFLIPRPIATSLTPNQSPISVSIRKLGEMSNSGSSPQVQKPSNQTNSQSGLDQKSTAFSASISNSPYKIQDAKDLPQRNADISIQVPQSFSITSNTDEQINPPRPSQMKANLLTSQEITNQPEVPIKLSEQQTILPNRPSSQITEKIHELSKVMSDNETQLDLDQLAKASTLPMFEEIQLHETQEFENKEDKAISPIPTISKEPSSTPIMIQINVSPREPEALIETQLPEKSNHS